MTTEKEICRNQLVCRKNPEAPMKKSRDGHISWNQKCLNKEAMRTRGESRIGTLRGVEGGKQ